jgi:hypothetical protein
MIFRLSDIHQSPSRALNRQRAAEAVLGKATVARLIGFALFLLGGKRENIAAAIGIPTNTYLSFLTRMNRLGLDGFRDRRRNVPTPAEPVAMCVDVIHQHDGVILRLLPTTAEILLQARNDEQNRIMVLALATNGLLSSQQAGELLQVSTGYIPALCRKLGAEDAHAVLDRRVGQQKDYRVTEQMKAELVVQWAANAAAGKTCSSPALSADLRDRCGIDLSERTIRHHLSKLGLLSKAKALSGLIGSVKKSS